jgi:hypothetical protein
LIFTVFYLQIFFSSNIQLKILGDFDSIYHKDVLGCQYSDYSKKILDLISQLPWAGSRPEFIHNLNASEWLNHLPQNGFFISTSNLISEDFSVTAAQLEEIGYPMLLPHWGGFIDAIGSNIKHYSAEIIGSSHQSLSSISRQAKIFSQMIINKQFLTVKNSDSQLNFIPSKKINLQFLEDIYIKNLEKWGSEIQLLRKREIATFALTQNGQFFFKEYRRLFAK